MMEIKNTKIEKILQELAKLINSMMPKGWGFTLLIFDYTDSVDKGSMFYISSARRKDMVKAMMEFIDKQQKDEIIN